VNGIRHGQRVFVQGQTLKGKTTFTKRLVLEELQPVRVICFDVKDELDFPGVEKCYTPAELAANMHGKIVHFVPSSFEREVLEEACQIVWETPGPYVWWITEAAEITQPGYCPAGLRFGYTQGGRWKKTMIAEAQRCSETHPVLRSQADHFVLFVPPPIELDLKTLAGHIGVDWRTLERELLELQAQEGDFSHLWYLKDGNEIRRMAPIPLEGGDTRPQLAPATAEDEEAQQSASWQAEASAEG
jgi:hypothetical protein